MKALIVEDENLAIKRLRKIISEIDEPIEVMSVTQSIADTVSWLKGNETPDIIFMDIELADGQSFEIFNQVEVKSTVIFTTSYNQYALKAFQVNSIDYLLKPVEKEDLSKAIGKYKQLKQLYSQPTKDMINIEMLLKDMHQSMNRKTYRKRFLVKSGTKFISIDVDEIASFYIDGRLVFFKTYNNKKFVVDYTMDELEEMLDPGIFFRINRSCYVSHKSIQQIEEHFGSRLFLHLEPKIDKESIVSREKVGAFKEWMGR